MNKKHIIYILIALFFAACKEDTSKTHDDEHGKKDTIITVTYLEITKFQFQSAGLELGPMQLRNMTETVKANGKLDVPPQNFAEVSTYIGGIVKSILVLEGDFVGKGQTVMYLEHPDYVKLQEEYMTMKSQIDFTEKEFLRQQELYFQNVSSGKVFQQAQAKFNAEKSRLSSLENQLNMLSISTAQLDRGIITRSIPLKAPISGYVGHLKTSLGGYAEPNKTLFDVINTSDIHVHVDVFEKDMKKLKIGQKLLVNLPNQSSEPIEAVIFSIGKMLNETTKTVEIHADVKNNKRNDLIPGTYVNAEIAVDERSVNTVPEAAIVRVGEKQYVFLAGESNKAGNKVKSDSSKTIDFLPGYQMIEIKTGASANGFVEIIPLQPLKDSDLLVIKGAYFLISQLKSGETVGCCDPEEKK
jgi:cobalt-zinc-cadmium efflux system membrane fusion protein